MKVAAETVLVVEDDQAVREYLADNLRADRFQVLEADCVKDARSLLERKSCDLVLLDLVLPDGSGHDLCERVRTANGIESRVDPNLPFIVLSARASDTDRVRGFDRGADDYLTKPFHYPELLARIRAVLRRSNDRRRKGAVQVGEISINPTTRTVKVGKRKIDLSAKEFSLLHLLTADPTRVWTKQELLKKVWGYESLCRTRTLDSHASRLRRKLDGGSGRFVINVWGVGYRLLEVAE